MKKFYSLIFAVFASISLMGQAGIKNHFQDIDIYKIKKGSHNKRVLCNSFSYQNLGVKLANTFIYKLDSTLTEYYSNFDNKWFLGIKEVLTYDSNKKVASYAEYEYGGGEGLWDTQGRIEFTYDENGNLKLVNELNLNAETNQYYDYGKSEFTYDAGSKLIQIEDYLWDEDRSEWKSDGTVKLTYDSNGVLITILYYGSDREEYTYDDNGRLKEITGIYSEGGLWKNSSKEEYIYNANDQVISLNGYYWDSGNSEWVNYRRDDYSYDTNGNPVEEINFQNSGPGTDLVAQQKFEYNYDLDYSLSNLIIPSLDFFYPDFYDEIVNKPLNYYLLYPDISTSEWGASSRTTYFYSEEEIETSIGRSTNELIISPNPASEYIQVSLSNFSTTATLDLYNILGKKIFSQKLPPNGKVPVMSLPGGLYIYKLSDDASVYSGKIIIEK